MQSEVCAEYSVQSDIIEMLTLRIILLAVQMFGVESTQAQRAINFALIGSSFRTARRKPHSAHTPSTQSCTIPAYT